MANVLPPESQKKVWAMYRSRLVLVTSIAFVGLAAVAALSLVPSYVALQVVAPAKPATGATTELLQDDAIALERSQLLIQELQPSLESTSSPSTIVESALSRKPSGVRISRVIYTGGEQGTLTLIGAGTRAQVSAYKDALVASGIFDGVSVPVGALVSEGGGFSIVLSGTF